MKSIKGKWVHMTYYIPNDTIVDTLYSNSLIQYNRRKERDKNLLPGKSDPGRHDLCRWLRIVLPSVHNNGVLFMNVKHNASC